MHNSSSQAKRFTRTAAVILAILFLSMTVIASPTSGAEDEQCAAAQVSDPPTHSVLVHEAIDTFGENQPVVRGAPDLDTKLQEKWLVSTDVDDTAVGGKGGYSDDAVPEHLAQAIEAVPTSELLQDLLSLTELEGPFLFVKADVIEDSKHKETWTFDVIVKAFCGGYLVGWGYNGFTEHDEYGSHQVIPHRMEVPLKNLEVDVADVDALEISVQTMYCKVGWYWGGGKHTNGDRCIYENGADSNGAVHYEVDFNSASSIQ